MDDEHFGNIQSPYTALFVSSPMLCHPWPEPHLDCLLRKHTLRGLGRPDVGIAGAQGGHLCRGQISQGGDGALHVLEPLR
jgi:hypothetical protein